MIEEKATTAFHLKEKASIENKALAFIRKKAKEAQPLIINGSKDTLLKANRHRINVSFPATTIEISQKLQLSTSTTFDLLNRLRIRKKIKSRKFSWFNGKKIKFYIPYSEPWPSYVFSTCGSCENWNRFTHCCTFLRELKEKGYLFDKQRINHRITSKLVACKWRIARSARALRTFNSLQQFALETFDLKIWWHKEECYEHFFFIPKNFLPAFRCFYCKKPLQKFGWGYLPLIGSAIFSCPICGSFYKLKFNEETNKFEVIASKEKYQEYSLRFFLFTKGETLTPNYSSEKYGLSLVDFDAEIDLHDELKALTNKNLFAYYNRLDFLVVKDKEQFALLTKRFQKDYPEIKIIFGNEQLKSVQPTKQQIGAVALLRFEGSLNVPYSQELLWSRINVLEQISEYYPKKNQLMKKEEKLYELLIKVKQIEKTKQQLSTEQWNILDGQAARIVWDVIKEIVEKHNFEFPNRAYARHLENDILRPHGLYPSYSDANTVFNAAFRKITNFYLKKCNEHEFPWEGLEGFCHKKTSKGVYGFTLDNEECIKQATIPSIIKLIVERKLTPEMITKVRMRKRIPIYYLEQKSLANKLLDENCSELLEKKVVTISQGEERKVTLRRAIEYLVVSLKKLLEDIVNFNSLTCNIKGIKTAPWLLAAEGRLGELHQEQQKKIRRNIREVLLQVKSYFKPFRYQLEFSKEKKY